MSEATRVERNAVQASFWQFDPKEEDPEVEGMDSALGFLRNEGHVLVSVRGKPGKRYEPGDSVWLEFTDEQVVRLIERLAATLGQPS